MDANRTLSQLSYRPKEEKKRVNRLTRKEQARISERIIL